MIHLPRHCVCTLVVGLALTSAGRAQAPPTAVSAEAVRRESVQEHRRVTGELRALRRSRVATQEPGLVVALPAREGQRVEVGDLLARLDSRRLDVELRAIEADEQAIAGIVEERQATLEWRKRDLELYQVSFDRGAANPKEMLDAESAVRIAEARARQAQRQRAVMQARADLLKERLADTTITAPFDGVVVRRHAELGEWVGEGDAVVELVSTGRIEAWLEIPQRHFGAFGAEVEISLCIGATAQSITLSANRVVPQVDPRARSFYVVLGLDDETGRLAPGMSVTAWVPTGRSAERLTVPKDAILRNDAGSYVYVARGDAPNEPAKAMAVRVEVLFPVADRMVVSAAGLEAGDLVVVEGNERLFPMTPIVPIVRETAGPDEAGGGP